MPALDKFIERLNQKPILWSLGLGVTVYCCAFWLSVFAMFASITPLFEVGFLMAGSIVLGYHWVMSRYINANAVAQVVQISFGLCLVSASMFLIGAATHAKAYEWVNKLLY